MKSIFIFGKKDILINYFNCFTTLGYNVIISKDIIKANNADLLLLAGGGDICPFFYGEKDTFSTCKDPLRDFAELELIYRFIKQKKPIIGICRGLQVINIYFGGTLFQDIKGHSQQFNKDTLHNVFCNPKGLLYKYCGNFCQVNSAHHQSIKHLANNFAIDCISEQGIIEGIFHNTLPILAYQFHPERLNNKKVLNCINDFIKKTL